MFPISFNDKVNKLTSLINAGIPSYIPSVWLSIVQHVMSCFEKIRLRPQNDKWLISGNSEKFRRKVLGYVVGGAPIPFVLPAFPMKSKNRIKKTIGPLPDMAEWISLKHLANFCREIRKIYAPGVKILIFGDGRLYGKILKYDDSEITEYERVFKDMLSRLPEEIHDQLLYAGIDDYFERDMGYDKIRSYVYSLYDVTMEEVDNAIRTNENINNVYKGFARYLDEDLEGDIPKDISRTKRKQITKDFARKLLRGNMVYSLVIKDIFPHHLRLSIHPHNNEDKVGVSLLENQRFSAGTPWHRVAAKKKDGHWYFMRRIDAEAMNYKLKGQFNGEGTANRENWPHYVEE
ncbi:DgyrCDS8449 [Dimorphilus gyrociliatus]|uniref:DgyrCDS8449 n=1 Tax=Dimorphilus gyrociliatus TaxID=2664684 RepID=A0A7I8VVW4_9ANNE|nr:DgyrCDS8449 [Dimorphilus gyrociliatus]